MQPSRAGQSQHGTATTDGETQGEGSPESYSTRLRCLGGLPVDAPHDCLETQVQACESCDTFGDRACPDPGPCSPGKRLGCFSACVSSLEVFQFDIWSRCRWQLTGEHAARPAGRHGQQGTLDAHTRPGRDRATYLESTHRRARAQGTQ